MEFKPYGLRSLKGKPRVFTKPILSSSEPLAFLKGISLHLLPCHHKQKPPQQTHWNSRPSRINQHVLLLQSIDCLVHVTSSPPTEPGEAGRACRVHGLPDLSELGAAPGFRYERTCDAINYSDRITTHRIKQIETAFYRVPSQLNQVPVTKLSSSYPRQTAKHENIPTTNFGEVT